MAKKKRSSRKRGPSRRNSTGMMDFPPMIDRRALEGVMRQFISEMMGDAVLDEPEDEAQSLLQQAFDTDDPKRREQLAKQALKANPDHADAYVLLAENADTPQQAIEFYRQGVAAGERSIGEKHFRDYVGHFWGLMETRPYMRAREGLARCLWLGGQRDEAMGHYRELLRLNPHDNQGVRYTLAALLPEMQRDDELQRLFEAYPDDGAACWAYGRALLAFRREGDSPASRKLLNKAKKCNPFVPKYLTGNEQLPPEMPGYYSPGDETEAVDYVAAALSGWKTTPGAVAWLRKTLKVPVPSQPQSGDSSWLKKKLALLKLPQAEDAVWQVDARRIWDEMKLPGDLEWIMIVTDPSENNLLASEPAEEEPSAEDMLDVVFDCMRLPQSGDRQRPQSIQVTNQAWQKAWTKKLRQLEIDCQVCDQLDHVDHVLQVISQGMPLRGDSAEEACDVESLRQLPQDPLAVWQADWRRLPSWIEQDGQLERPWIVLVTDRMHDLVLTTDMSLDQPPPERVWQMLAQAMQRPAMGDPQRPAIVEVSSGDLHRYLKPLLEPLRIQCNQRDELAQLNKVFFGLMDATADRGQMAALLEVPGLAESQVGSFFAAAADYYRRAPWRHIPGDTLIQVECDKFQTRTWYAVVMGQVGVSFGLSLHDNLADLKGIILGDRSDEENARQTSALSLNFGEAFEIAPRDLDAAERLGWPIAAPEAHPGTMRVEPGGLVRPPLAWELELLEGCLRAIPDFVASGAGGTKTFTAQLESGPLTLTLKQFDAF